MVEKIAKLVSFGQFRKVIAHEKTYSVLFAGDRGESVKKYWTALSAQSA